MTLAELLHEQDLVCGVRLRPLQHRPPGGSTVVDSLDPVYLKWVCHTCRLCGQLKIQTRQ